MAFTPLEAKEHVHNVQLVTHVRSTRRHQDAHLTPTQPPLAIGWSANLVRSATHATALSPLKLLQEHSKLPRDQLDWQEFAGRISVPQEPGLNTTCVQTVITYPALFNFVRLKYRLEAIDILTTV